MKVRTLVAADIREWVELRAALWPDQSLDELEVEGRAALAKDPPLVVFVAEVDSVLAGFIEFGFRSVAEGCETSPVPYVEGWFVRDDYRRRGIGAALMLAVENWCRARGFVELGSDANASNRLSRDVHAALGFEEVETLVVFRRAL
jgi:aminoglycoside 6'-N-acetyltransferase I